MLKTNHWTYRIKNLNGEKIIGNFYEKEVLLNKLYLSYYPEPDSHIRLNECQTSIRLVKLCNQQKIRTYYRCKYI